MADQPFFSIQDIHTLVRANDFAFANSRAQHRAQDLGWDNACVKAFLLAIRVAHFYKPFANQLAFDGRHKLHTDAYRMHFDEELLAEGNSNVHPCFFTKLGIHKNPSRRLVAVVSFHLDGSP